MAKNGKMHPTRIFKTPEDLKKAFNEYKLDLEEHSKEWLKVQYVGKDGAKKEDKQKLPMIFDGFEVFCKEVGYGEIEQYFKNKGEYYNDFIPLCRAIKKEIRVNQITGGMLGFFNPSITQRLNNLSENNVTTIREQPLFSDGE